MLPARLAVALVCSFVLLSGIAEAAEPQAPIVVHLTKYTGDSHAAMMALKLAKALAEQKAKVVLLLDLEGVRLADARLPADVRFGSGVDLGIAYEEFIKAGGTAMLCTHCAAAAGIAIQNLRTGARIASESELAGLVIKATRILDY